MTPDTKNDAAGQEEDECAQCRKPLRLLSGIVGWRQGRRLPAYWFCSLHHLLEFARARAS
jgi:hypothetical protein